MTAAPDERFDQLIETLREAVNFEYVDGGDGYNKSAEVIKTATLATFNWVCGRVGASGFQASWAAIEFLAGALSIDGPFKIVKLEDALYPQYDLLASTAEFIGQENCQKWLREKAAQRLASFEAEPVLTGTPDEDGNIPSMPAVHPSRGRSLAEVGGVMTGPEPVELLTPGEVAKLFRVDPKTVTRWARAGKIPSIRTVGGHRRYPAGPIHAALANSADG